MCEKLESIRFQCCYCRLPKLKGFEEPSHGFHETCLMVDQPEYYRMMLDKLDPGQPVSG